jgi:sugar lactone lactonase YvrE
MRARATVALDGLGVPESLRWHENALWFCDLAFGTVHRWDGQGAPETITEVPGRAGGLGWLPDGRMLVVSMDEHRVYRREPDGQLVEHADLGHIAGGPVNDMTVDDHGRAYVGNFGFDYHAYIRSHPQSQLYAPPGPPPAQVACLDPDGGVVGLSQPLLFPNGCFVTDDGTTLILAETLALRLVALPVRADGTLGPATEWAPLISPLLWRLLNSAGVLGRVTRRVSQLFDHPVLAARSSSPIAPDGIAPGDAGTVWAANALRGECVRVARGGRVVDRIATSGPTLSVLQAGRTLYAATVATTDPVEARRLRRGRVELCQLAAS